MARDADQVFARLHNVRVARMRLRRRLHARLGMRRNGCGARRLDLRRRTRGMHFADDIARDHDALAGRTGPRSPFVSMMAAAGTPYLRATTLERVAAGDDDGRAAVPGPMPLRLNRRRRGRGSGPRGDRAGVFGTTLRADRRPAPARRRRRRRLRRWGQRLRIDAR